MEFKEIVRRAAKIKEKYHELEIKKNMAKNGQTARLPRALSGMLAI